MRSSDRREARRVRRGRQAGSQQGKGHGETIYRPVKRTNSCADEAGRLARRDEQQARDERARARWAALAKAQRASQARRKAARNG